MRATIPVLLLALGCAHSHAPLRTADVTRDGEATVTVYTTLAWEPGVITQSDGEIERIPAVGDPAWLTYVLMVLNLDVTMRFGVGGGCEVGTTIGAGGLGLEGRCGLVRGEPTAIAAAIAAGWRYGLFARGGLDVSHRFDDAAVLGHLYASFGTELRPRELTLFGGAASRDELRLTGGVGIAGAPSGWPAGEASALVLLSTIAPWVVLWSGEAVYESPGLHLFCGDHCGPQPSPGDRFDSPAGVAVMAGMATQSGS